MVGISAHQKLDLLSSLVTLLGFEGLSVFGDCFDEVTLLDPVRFPGPISYLGESIHMNRLLCAMQHNVHDLIERFMNPLTVLFTVCFQGR